MYELLASVSNNESERLGNINLMSIPESEAVFIAAITLLSGVKYGVTRYTYRSARVKMLK